MPAPEFKPKDTTSPAWLFWRWRGWLLLPCLLILTAAESRTQEVLPDEIIKIEANLVSVPVSVSDSDGRYLPGLRQTDFKLYDDGAVREIAFFDAAEEPLNVALLLDTSGSTKNVLDKIKSAAKSFIDKLRPGDRAMIVSFDTEVYWLSGLTDDRKVLEKAIKRATVAKLSGTVLNDAIVNTIDRELKPVAGRKAMILLTDGEDLGSKLPGTEVLGIVAEADTMIYSVRYPIDPFPPHSNAMVVRQRGLWSPWPAIVPMPGATQRQRAILERRNALAETFLTKLSSASGGRFYSSKLTNLKKTFGLIADELRYQYRLGFYPDPDSQAGLIRTLKVTVDRPGVAVRSRRSYRTAER